MVFVSLAYSQSWFFVPEQLRTKEIPQDSNYCDKNCNELQKAIKAHSETEWAEKC
jgi:hypothetical protein